MAREVHQSGESPSFPSDEAKVSWILQGGLSRAFLFLLHDILMMIHVIPRLRMAGNGYPHLWLSLIARVTHPRNQLPPLPPRKSLSPIQKPPTKRKEKIDTEDGSGEPGALADRRCKREKAAAKGKAVVVHAPEEAPPRKTQLGQLIARLKSLGNSAIEACLGDPRPRTDKEYGSSESTISKGWSTKSHTSAPRERIAIGRKLARRGDEVVVEGSKKGKIKTVKDEWVALVSGVVSDASFLERAPPIRNMVARRNGVMRKSSRSDLQIMESKNDDGEEALF
ncbi:hypothetical protein ACFE04_009274 [Oxalis oulophora]